MEYGEENNSAVKNHLLLACLAFLACPLQAFPAQPAGPEVKNPQHVQIPKKQKPFTILYIKRYDDSESVEVVKISEGMWRVQQLMSDLEVWKKADQLARAKWSEWFRGSENLERSARRWVLPNPAPPQYSAIGQYEDEFETEDKVKELQGQIQRRLGMRRATGDRIYLDNLHENQRLLKAVLPQARQAIIKRDEIQAKRFNVAKKKAIWDLVHLAEFEARKRAAEKNVKGGDLDILEVYNIQQELLKPIYLQYDIDEGQWFVIWTEGDFNKWPIPKPPAEEKAEKAKENDADGDPEAEKAARLERAAKLAEAEKAARFAKASEASRVAGAEQGKKVAALSAKNEAKKEPEKLTPKQAAALVPDE